MESYEPNVHFYYASKNYLGGEWDSEKEKYT